MMRSLKYRVLILQNNACGTQLPLHLELNDRSLPSVNETLSAHVCSSYNVLGSWDCCVLRQRIGIKNCGIYYVYFLEPTDRCPVAYCTQGKLTEKTFRLI